MNRRNSVLAAASVLALSFSALWAAQKTGAPDLANGKAVYEDSCQQCHGVHGEGDRATEKKYNVKLKPLTDPSIQGKSDEELGKQSTEGIGKMKPVDLSPQETKDVVAYVRTFKK